MRYISEAEYNNEMRTIKCENESKARRRKLKAERKKGKPKNKTFSMSKIVLLGIILLCVEIVIFCEYAMLKLMDTSSMYVLIGIPVALAPIIWGYYSKSKAENTSGGIVFQSMMNEYNANNNVTSETSTGDEYGGDGCG